MTDEIYDLLLHFQREYGVTNAKLTWMTMESWVTPRIELFFEQYLITIQLRLMNIINCLEEYGYDTTVEIMEKEVDKVLLQFRKDQGDF